jgi:hypothetical protein
MPYIDPKRRSMEVILEQLVLDSIECSGDLNFAIAVLLGVYVEKTGLRYQNIHDAADTAINCAIQFKDRIEVPYEVIARTKNGDVNSWDRLDRLVQQKLSELK